MIFYLLMLLSLGYSQVCKNKCNAESPCCSEHGYCGSTYQYCGMGCIKQESYNNSCITSPACSSKVYDFKDESRIVSKSDYHGDSENIDFIVHGGYYINENDNLVLKMKKGFSSKLISTRYINYGKIKVNARITSLNGLVSSIILLSDEKDEIDFEFIRNSPFLLQTNYYSRGILNHKNGFNHFLNFSTNEMLNEYTIDWSPERINWFINGDLTRTVESKYIGKQNYPSTKSRIELGIWDGGAEFEGTRQWAGGYIDWESKLIKNGHFEMEIQSITVECYDE